MCQSNTELQFCTCLNKDKPTVHNKKSRRHNKQLDKNAYLEQHLVWELHHYMGNIDSMLTGMILLPSHQLTAIVNNKFVLEKINTKNCFDFEYIPTESDNLIIRVEYKQKKQVKKSNPSLSNYLSFIYKKGAWQTDYYDVFTEKREQFQYGQLRLIKS